MCQNQKYPSEEVFEVKTGVAVLGNTYGSNMTVRININNRIDNNETNCAEWTRNWNGSTTAQLMLNHVVIACVNKILSDQHANLVFFTVSLHIKQINRLTV